PPPLRSPLLPYTTLFRSVGVVLVHHLAQGLAEVAHQGAADAPGVQLVDLDARLLQKAAVDADLAELVLDQHHLLPLEGLTDQQVDRKSTRLNSSHVSISY